MNNKLYVGNLDYKVTAEDLKLLFKEFGTIIEILIIKGKGFGFVKMSSSSEAELAKNNLAGKFFFNRALKIDIATPKLDESQKIRKRY